MGFEWGLVWGEESVGFGFIVLKAFIVRVSGNMGSQGVHGGNTYFSLIELFSTVLSASWVFVCDFVDGQ